MAKPEIAVVVIFPRDNCLFATVDGKALGTIETDAKGEILIRPYRTSHFVASDDAKPE